MSVRRLVVYCGLLSLFVGAVHTFAFRVKSSHFFTYWVLCYHIGSIKEKKSWIQLRATFLVKYIYFFRFSKIWCADNYMLQTSCVGFFSVRCAAFSKSARPSVTNELWAHFWCLLCILMKFVLDCRITNVIPVFVTLPMSWNSTGKEQQTGEYSE